TVSVPLLAGTYRYQTSGDGTTHEDEPSTVAPTVVSVKKNPGQTNWAFAQASVATTFVGFDAVQGFESNALPCKAISTVPSSVSSEMILTTAVLVPTESASNATTTP